jgi:hypothetical protein
MELMTSWQKLGIERDLERGKSGLLVKQIDHRFGKITDQQSKNLHSLTSDQLEALAEAF